MKKIAINVGICCMCYILGVLCSSYFWYARETRLVGEYDTAIAERHAEYTARQRVIESELARAQGTIIGAQGIVDRTGERLSAGITGLQGAIILIREIKEDVKALEEQLSYRYPDFHSYDWATNLGTN